MIPNRNPNRVPKPSYTEVDLNSEGESRTKTNIPRRNRIANVWRVIFLASTVVGIIVLTLLLYNIVNQAFGYVAVKYELEPTILTESGAPLEALSNEELIIILREHVTINRFRTIEREKPLDTRTQEELIEQIYLDVVKPRVENSWSLRDSLTQFDKIKIEHANKYPDSYLYLKSWTNRNFITSPQSSDALQAGIRTAILGSLWIIAITVLVAFPIGVGAAIYLEEYAQDNTINRILQTNINNLAGVPSIIYGMLGLAVFVRMFEPITSGKLFGIANATSENGRTILSAGLALALLILPVIIINAQEAIRAIPRSLREASYGLGATKWQTIWYHVLPNSIPGILTGTILSLSRAFGETAPLVVIGAATYITFDPTGVFSKFTALPIQIYQWSVRPQAEFRNIAAAAILVLLFLLLSMNAVAIFLRNRYSRRLS